MVEDPLQSLDASTVQGLTDLVDALRSLLISVATGGPRIEEMDATYKKCHLAMRVGLERHGIDPQFKWNSLWDWYCSGKLGSYAERRTFINQLADPVLERLVRLAARGGVSDGGDAPETWGTLEERLEELKAKVPTCVSLDDRQDIGRRAREIVIAAINLVFGPEMVPDGTEVPKGAGAKNRLDFVMDSLVPGAAHTELRQLMRTLLEPAHKINTPRG